MSRDSRALSMAAGVLVAGFVAVSVAWAPAPRPLWRPPGSGSHIATLAAPWRAAAGRAVWPSTLFGTGEPVGCMSVKFTDPRCEWDSPDSYTVYVVYVEGDDSTAEYAGETTYMCDGVGLIQGTFAYSSAYQACLQATTTCPEIGCSSWLSGYFGQGPGTVTNEHCV